MKNFIFSAVLLAFVYCLIELASYGAYRIKYGSYKLYDIQHSKLAAVEKPNESKVFQPEEAIQKDVEVKPILHPYLGYTVDGKKRDAECQPQSTYDCYSRIKSYVDEPLEKRSDDKLIVALVGGSFADGTARGGTQRGYQKFLKSIPEFSDREIILYNLAAGGYKQPQQLMYINYFYALGAEFDLIINIDGFNEIAASFYGWRDYQLHPSFPVSWSGRVGSGINNEYIELVGQKQVSMKSHAARAKFWLVEGIRYSPLMNFLWNILDDREFQELADLDAKMIQVSKHEGKPRDFLYESLGPDYDLPEWDDFNKYAIDLWANSSRALNALAVGKGAQYFHFIQPNQYIEGSKPLSKFEQKNAVTESGGYGHVYKAVHPQLVTKGKRLAAEGINLIDLSNLFQQNSDTLYIDNCCHLNSKGYDLVVNEVVRQIALKNLN